MPHSRPIFDLPAPILVNTDHHFDRLLDHLNQVRLIALDTESDSLYSYVPKVCLLQISVLTDPSDEQPQGREPSNGALQNGEWLQVTDYLVDPLRLDISSLGPIFASPETETIMHSAENDILTLHRDFGFTFGRIFDTQLAARILGWSGVGLAAILEREYGVVSNKKMQRTNWGQRPLSAEQIAYAQVDSHYLLDLRVRLLRELDEAGRVQEAADGFDLLAQSSHVDRPQTERTVWSMKLARSVPYAQMGLLEELWVWREQEAARRDRPPFKIMGDKVLTDLVQMEPTSRSELGRVRGLSDHLVRRYGDALLKAVRRGRERPAPAFPNGDDNGPRLEGSVLACFDALRRWRTATAKGRGVDPDIVFSNDVLIQIAQQSPKSAEDLLAIPAIGPWKAKTYGPEIVRIVARKG